MEFKLTDDNYYGIEANKNFASVSQYKSFFHGEHCQARAFAEMNGEFVRETSTALLVGQYVDTALTEPENFEAFIEAHPEIISKAGASKGLPKSDFQRANQMIDRVKADKTMYSLVADGEHQQIMTGTLFGLDWKIKMDSYIPHKAIVDLKTVESMGKGFWNAEERRYETFIEHFGYLIQGAIYQEIVFQNTGERLPFYLACVSKEPITDIEVIKIDNETMHDIIYGNEFQNGIADNCEELRLIKAGEKEPTECGRCAWCLPRKKITKAVDWRELAGKV